MNLQKTVLLLTCFTVSAVRAEDAEQPSFDALHSSRMVSGRAATEIYARSWYSSKMHPLWQRSLLERLGDLHAEEEEHQIPYKWFIGPELTFFEQQLSVASCLSLDRQGRGTSFLLTHLEDPNFGSSLTKELGVVSNLGAMSESLGVSWPWIRKHIGTDCPRRNLEAIAELWRQLDGPECSVERVRYWKQLFEKMPNSADSLARLAFIESRYSRKFNPDEGWDEQTKGCENHSHNWREAISIPFHQVSSKPFPEWIERERAVLQEKGAEIQLRRRGTYGLDPRTHAVFALGMRYFSVEDAAFVASRLDLVDEFLAIESRSSSVGRKSGEWFIQSSSSGARWDIFSPIGLTPRFSPPLLLLELADQSLADSELTTPYEDPEGKLDCDLKFEPRMAAMALARLGHQTIREREIDGETISPVLKHMEKPATYDNLEWVAKVIDYIDSNQMAKFRTELWIKEREKLIAEKPEKIIPEKRFFRGKEGGWIYRGFHVAIKNTDAFAYTNDQDRTENENISTMINALDEPTQKEWLARISGKPVEGASGKLPPEIEELLPKQVPEDDLVLKQLRKLREFLDKNKMVDISER